MKAKEYARVFQDNPSIETAASIATDFLNEAKRLRSIRHCQTDAALFAIFEEIDDKWLAFSRLVNSDIVPPDMYQLLLKQWLPEVYVAWQNYRMRRATH